MTEFFRFPHTPHLAWLGTGSPRDDKVLSPAQANALLDFPMVVEEKLDGANLGISIASDGRLQAQNRGQYLHAPFRGQFSRLGEWLSARRESMTDALDGNLIAFGEWCAARHSLAYASLPDWWMLFDMYDRGKGRFWSTTRRDAWAQALGLPVVPVVQIGRTNMAALKRLLASQSSRYRDGPMEGVVVRVEDADWLTHRAKLVRSDFTQQISGHWRSGPLAWNQLESTV